MLHVCYAEITNAMLRDKREFDHVGAQLNEWFEEQLLGYDCGVLVSHNTPVDIQYLLCEYKVRLAVTDKDNVWFGHADNTEEILHLSISESG